MIQITVKPQVLLALQAAFPKPANSASRALAKYIRVLEDMIFNSLQHVQTPMQRKFGLFPIGLKELRNLGGQIGPNKVPVHAWLEANNLSLVQKVVQGSNLTGLVSDVKLTNLVTIVNTLSLEEMILSIGTTDDEIELYLSGDDFSCRALFYKIYPELRRPIPKDQFDKTYDSVPVDIESLKAYIIWLATEAKYMSPEQKNLALRQAQMILASAQVIEEQFIQKKKPSEFGRTYYEGVSIQSVNRELRRAILGNCWEYDIRSSVVTWKMGFAKSYIDTYELGKPINEVFKTTLLYLEDKPDLMATVRLFTFVDRNAGNRDFHFKLLKQAFTAISFGARQSSKGWLSESGEWTNPALVSILKNADDRARFLADVTVQAFIKEQSILDDHIINLVKAQRRDLLLKPILQTATGRLSKAKILAYLYQHDETEIMDVVSSVAARFDRIPIARVHDAIFFRRKLTLDQRHEIELQMQDHSNNPYWRLSPKELTRYEKKYIEVPMPKKPALIDPELEEFNRQVADFMMHFG
jgi:hypothetical protein